MDYKDMNVVRQMVADGQISQEVVEKYFPELKESEDEKIRKELIRMVKEDWLGRKDVIAWLEKQGGHAKFINGIQVGDKVTRNEDGVLVNLSQLNRVAKKDEKQGEQNLVNTDLDELVIQLEETIGTSPHSRETIKDFFQRAVQKYMNCLRIANGEIGRLIEENYNLKEKQGEQKPTNKVEPKFEVGDLITNGILVGEIDEIHELGYHAYFGDHYADVPDIDNWHKWTIQDAKPGDVLVNQNGVMPFIFKECKNNHIYCYCGYTNHKDIFFDRFVDSEGEELHWSNLYHEQVYPATKGQRDLLFQKMKKAGYEWNANKKELKKIEQKPVVFTPKFCVGDMIIHKELGGDYIHTPHKIIQVDILDKKYRLEGGLVAHFCEQDDYELVEQKPAWSEEDELMLMSIIQTLKLTNGAAQMKIDWLKSLKDRVQPQPKQEWSKEDNAMLIEIEDILTVRGHSFYDKEIAWLKSLRPQNTWKPSVEQMHYLSWIANIKLGDSVVEQEVSKHLNELLEDLKKLKEE